MGDGDASEGGGEEPTVKRDGDGLVRIEARIQEDELERLREHYPEQVTDSGRVRTAIADGVRWRQADERLALEGEIRLQVEHVAEDDTDEE